MSLGDRKLRVLVVDDSALVREVLYTLLSHEGFEVNVAADPFIAMDKMKGFEPDVMVLDLEMPRMDGLTFLKKLMAERPLPVVICSAVAARGTENAMRALEEGALDIVVKPQIGVRDFLYESAVTLSDAIRAAAQARPKSPRALRVERPRAKAPVAVRASDLAAVESPRVVVIGASTGGTDALRVILSDLPADAPGILIVQHMPRFFTRAFAGSLDQASRLSVREAADGDRVVRGQALVAPGDAHLALARATTGYVVRVFDGPLVSRHRPSVDVLFRSAAEAAGPDALGVILTGMGNDGADGMAAMYQAGATTIAQDETTSIIFGMPKEAILRGAVSQILPLNDIPAAISRFDRKESLHDAAITQ